MDIFVNVEELKSILEDMEYANEEIEKFCTKQRLNNAIQKIKNKIDEATKNKARVMQDDINNLGC